MIVLDTDVLSLIQRRSEPEYSRLRVRLRDQSDPVFVTIVTFEEQVRGWMSRLARRNDAAGEVSAYRRLRDLVEYYRDQRLLDFTQQSADVFAGLRKARVRVGTMDLRIASIVLANDALLISRNLSDFERVPGLRVEDWTITS